ncbi:hypothetical protein ACFQ0G_53205 [Streptomyces chiangmaiensis]
MITPKAAVAACTRAAEELAAGHEWQLAAQYTVRSLIDRLAAVHGLPPPGWSTRRTPRRPPPWT